MDPRGARLASDDTVARSASKLLRLENVSVDLAFDSATYGSSRTVRVVDGVTFDIEKGNTLGLVGESGCGKTTVAKAVLGLHKAAEGRILIKGLDISRLSRSQLNRARQSVQMIFQDPYSSLDPRMPVYRLVSEPLRIHAAGSPTARTERVTQLLSAVGLNAALARRYPHELSGGQRQRVGIARALAPSPDLIVADEPVSALDVSIQAQIINLMRSLQTRLGLTYLFISHDLSVVRYISDRVAVMYLGRIVELGDVDDVYSDPAHPYTIALLSAVRIPDPQVEVSRRRVVLSGDTPNPASPPMGCRFHPRCWLRETLGKPEICARSVPPLRQVDRDHVAACHFTDEARRSLQRRQAILGI